MPYNNILARKKLTIYTNPTLARDKGQDNRKQGALEKELVPERGFCYFSVGWFQN
jgi:hypothetical protein